MLAQQNLNTYRTRLESMKSRVDAHFSELLDENPQSSERDARMNFAGEPGDAADRGCEQCDVDVAIGVAKNEARLRAEITAALERIDAGTYGICEDCGAAIRARRLNAVPYARHCIRCERRTGQEV